MRARFWRTIWMRGRCGRKAAVVGHGGRGAGASRIGRVLGHSEASHQRSPWNAREFCMSLRKAVRRGTGYVEPMGRAWVLPESCERRCCQNEQLDNPSRNSGSLFVARQIRRALSMEGGRSVSVRNGRFFPEGVGSWQNSPARSGIPRFFSETPLQNVHDSAGLHALAGRARLIQAQLRTSAPTRHRPARCPPGDRASDSLAAAPSCVQISPTLAEKPCKCVR
jgi:hypothetical protein